MINLFDEPIAMTRLTNLEKHRLERALCMGGGYVLNFSNRTFSEFFRDSVGVDIDEQNYLRGSGSKANRMRAYWDTAEPKQLMKVLEALIEGWDIYADGCVESDKCTLQAIVTRMRRDGLNSSVLSHALVKRLEDLRFLVALSFPGTCRGYVEQIAIRLRSTLGAERVFYDMDFQAQLARPNLDILLQKIYHDQSDLIVVFLSGDYDASEWCGLEWRVIRDIIKRKRADQVMFVRFDDAPVPGSLSIDGYIDARQHDAAAVSQFIIQRAALSPLV